MDFLVALEQGRQPIGPKGWLSTSASASA